MRYRLLLVILIIGVLNIAASNELKPIQYYVFHFVEAHYVDHPVGIHYIDHPMGTHLGAYDIKSDPKYVLASLKYKDSWNDCLSGVKKMLVNNNQIDKGVI